MKMKVKTKTKMEMIFVSIIRTELLKTKINFFLTLEGKKIDLYR